MDKFNFHNLKYLDNNINALSNQNNGGNYK